MKKYFIFLFLIVILGGCSFKNEVKYYEERMIMYTPSEIANIFVTYTNKKIPHRILAKDKKSELLIYEVYSKKNKVFLLTKIKNLDENRSDKELYTELIENKKTILAKKIYKSFCKKPKLRAVLKSNIEIITNIKIGKNELLVEGNETFCKKHFD